MTMNIGNHKEVNMGLEQEWIMGNGNGNRLNRGSVGRQGRHGAYAENPENKWDDVTQKKK